VTHRGILTGENLRRRGWEGPYICPLCSQDEETTDHFLLQCAYSKEVWQLDLGMKPGTFSLPQETSTLLRNCISQCPFQATKKGQLSTLSRALPKFIFWKIWLERNNRIFRETSSNPAQVATRIKAYFGESSPYFYKSKISGTLESDEEQWIKKFKIRDHSKQTRSKGKHETWEIWKEEEDFEKWK